MSALKSIKIETRAHFIWIRGVLLLGGFVFIASFLLELYRDSLQFRGLLVRLILCPIFGYIWGVLTWKYARKKNSGKKAITPS